MNINLKLIVYSTLFMALMGCASKPANAPTPEKPIDLTNIHNYNIRHKVVIKEEAQLKNHQYSRKELESIRVEITPVLGKILQNRNVTTHEIVQRLKNIPHDTLKLPWVMWAIPAYDVRPVVTTREVDMGLVEATVVGYRGNFGYSPIRLYIDPKYPENSCSNQFIVKNMKKFLVKIRKEVLKTHLELTRVYNNMAYSAPHYQAGSMLQLRNKYNTYSHRSKIKFILEKHKKRMNYILFQAHSNSLYNKMKQTCENH